MWHPFTFKCLQEQYEAAVRASCDADSNGAGGVLVALALYIDASLLPRQLDLLQVPGADLLRQPRTLNVTRQVQLCTEQSDTPQGCQIRLSLPPKPKSAIPGIVDPCPGRPKSLLLRYWFAGRPHQAVFDDHQQIHLPRRQHMAACPHLQADYEAAAPLGACVLPSMPLSPPQGNGRRGGRHRSSMAPGDFPHPSQWTAASFLHESGTSTSDGTILAGQVLLSPESAQPASCRTDCGVGSEVPPVTPRKHRRPSTVMRRASVQVAAVRKGCDGCPLAGGASQLQSRKPAQGVRWPALVSAGLIMGGVGIAVVLADEQRRTALKAWLAGMWSCEADAQPQKR